MLNPSHAPKASEEIGPRRATMPWGTSVSLAEYGAGLKRSGTAVLPGTPGTIWTRFDTAAMARLPGFSTGPVSQQEARQLLWQGCAGAMSFLLEPDGKHPANAWLYVCRDRSYGFAKLANEVRRHVRRAQGSLRIEPLEWKVLIENGCTAYSDTRARLGLSDGSLAHFRQRFDAFSSSPGHYVVGAWQGETLVAFVTLMVVDNWVTMEGSFSATTALAQRPNNGLAHYLLDYFLVKQGFETVCFGASSIQESAQNSGLHDYKVRIGFEAKPVHRAFIIHPVLRPFANRITLWSMKTALCLKPGNRRLSKAIGALNYLLSQKNTAQKLRKKWHKTMLPGVSSLP